MTTTGRVLGREEANRALARYAERAGQGKRPPILVFTGTGGSGKTAVLRMLGERIDQIVPYARVNLATTGQQDGMAQLLSALAYGLGRRCPGYGRLRFPRLVIGRLAMEESIDFTDPAVASQKMVDRIRRHRGLDKLWKVTRELAGDLIGLMGVSQELGTLLGRILGLVAEFPGAPTRANSLLLGAAYRWYGHRDQRLANTPIDVLTDLNRYARNLEDEVSRRYVEELLVDAFLADLREAFQRGTRSQPGMYGAVVLLDNADTELGQGFLDHFVRARSRAAALGLPAEPLAVAVSSQRQLSGPVNTYFTHHCLRDLTLDEVDVLARAELPSGVDHRACHMVHQLTGGHPGATVLVLATLAAWPSAAQSGIGALLAHGVPGSGAPDTPSPDVTVEAQLLKRLLTGVPELPDSLGPSENLIEALTIAAIARTREDIQRMLADHADDALIDATTVHNVGLWHEGEVSGGRGLLRWLLLRRALAREGEHLLELYRGLSEHCRKNEETGNTEETIGRLYHALCAGDLTQVAGRLDYHLPGHDLDRPWVEVLRAVATAPRLTSDGQTHEPHDLLTDLTRSMTQGGSRRMASVARVVAGVWIASDPRTGPNRNDLHTLVANDLRRLAPEADRPADLVREAQRHDQLARLWS